MQLPSRSKIRRRVSAENPSMMDALCLNLWTEKQSPVTPQVHDRDHEESHSHAQQQGSAVPTQHHGHRGRDSAKHPTSNRLK